MRAWALWIAITVPTADAGEHWLQAWRGASDDPDRREALAELAVALDLVPPALDQGAPELAPARRRVPRPASWRVRAQGEAVIVELDDPTGHLDRIRVWYRVEGERRPVRAVGRGAVRRFHRPRGWPERGVVEVEAASSLIEGAPALLRHRLAPVGEVPAPPLEPGREPAAASPPPPVEAAWRPPPWWLVVAGVAAAGAVGLGVWQETR